MSKITMNHAQAILHHLNVRACHLEELFGEEMVNEQDWAAEADNLFASVAAKCSCLDKIVTRNQMGLMMKRKGRYQAIRNGGTYLYNEMSLDESLLELLFLHS